MAKSKKVAPKKRGRPATGRDPVSAIRLPVELTASIDEWAEENAAGWLPIVLPTDTVGASIM
jgi:hypothetical protein